MADSAQQKCPIAVRMENLFEEGINKEVFLINEDYVPDKDSESKNDQNVSDEACNIFTEEQKAEANSLLGNYITKEYELLHLVLSHLPLGDLNAASQVCRTWQSAAASVRRSRTTPHWMFWRSGQGYKVRELAYGIASSKFSDGIASSPYMEFREHIYSEPVLAIMFASHHVFGARFLCDHKFLCPAKTPVHNDEEDRHKHRVWEYVRAELQPSCPLICLKGYGIIGTTPNLSATVELESSRAYSLLLLPEMPGVKMRTFHLNRSQVTLLDQAEPQTEYLEQLIGISPGECIKCLLLFCREATFFISATTHLVTALQMRQDEVMAVAGGMIADVGGVFDGVPVMVGVVFSGDGVSVASTVLDRKLRTERDVDKAMQELKAHTVSTYNSSIGLMFACVGRGKHYYRGKHNVESSAFKRYFPKTPLFGYFGNGEIGLKLLPDLSDNATLTGSAIKRRRTGIPLILPEILHSYTTIIVHLAFTGTSINNHAHR